ncbi:MAG: LysE family translocator [Caldimonas sp.]
MSGTHDLALFALTVLVVNATPGVDLLLTLSRTLQQGVRGGLAAAAGIACGCAFHTLAAAFGLAALLAASSSAFTAVKWLGAAYLAWLAVGMWRRAAAAVDAVEPAEAREVPSAPFAPPTLAELRRTFAQALLTNALNPKVAVFFLALLPQFIDASARSKPLAFAFLGVWFIAPGFAFLALFVFLVAPLRRWRPSVRWRRLMNASGGVLFAGLAARLALAERP